MSDCLFCNIAAGKIPADIVFEDDEVVVFRDINPKAEVHLLMIPREHIESLSALDDSHDQLLITMLKKLPELALEHGLSSGFRTIINTGKGGGQEVFHLHMHLMGGKNLPGF